LPALPCEALYVAFASFVNEATFVFAMSLAGSTLSGDKGRVDFVDSFVRIICEACRFGFIREAKNGRSTNGRTKRATDARLLSFHMAEQKQSLADEVGPCPGSAKCSPATDALRCFVELR
jgi:hypothetical protein